MTGLAAVTLLEWSPDGEYLLSGLEDGSFRIWETQKWTSAMWRMEVCPSSFCRTFHANSLLKDSFKAEHRKQNAEPFIRTSFQRHKRLGLFSTLA
jgi:WD40 repeat protein